MSTRFSVVLQIIVFLVAAGMIVLGVTLLPNSAGSESTTSPVDKLDSTVTTTTTRNDTVANRMVQTKNVEEKKFNSATNEARECDDCVKARYDQAYKYISLGLFTIFLLFLLPFLTDFNLLGLLSGKFRDRMDTLKTLSNKVEESTATASPVIKPPLTVKEEMTAEEEKLTTARRVVYYADDPQKGKWGSQSERNGRKLTANVTPDPTNPNLFDITLKVFSIDVDKPLKGYVLFHLHNTFLNPNPRIFVKEGEATLQLKAWGAFTVGAEADGGATRLELDLAEGTPEPFASR